MAGKIWVGLKPGLSTFRRCVRNKKNEITKTIEFQPGIPVELNPREAKVCADALGATLILVTPTDDPQKFQVDAAGTESMLFGVAMDRKKKGLDLAPHQRDCLKRNPEGLEAEELVEEEVQEEFEDPTPVTEPEAPDTAE